MCARMQVSALFDRIEALEIDLFNDVEERFIRGSGAGGQKINKTSNNVQLIHIREYQREVEPSACVSSRIFGEESRFVYAPGFADP